MEAAGHLTTFNLFLSHYGTGLDRNGAAWSARAYQDLGIAAGLSGFQPLSRQQAAAFSLPGGHTRSAVWSRATLRSLLVASWNGPDGIEASTTYDARPGRLARAARVDLLQQVRWAAAELSSTER